MTSSRSASHTLSAVAETNDRFSDFAPYVASINNDGIVAFQAKLRSGGSGVFATDGTSIATIADPSQGLFREVLSHPDISLDGSFCFYATLKSGESGVFLVRGNNVATLASSFGPLGPTMNDAGWVAFRADGTSTSSGIFAAYRGRITMHAELDAVFKAFHGLPVIGPRGSIIFRADLHAGTEGIHESDGGHTTTIIETGDVIKSLGSFPIRDDTGRVAFCATLRTGESGVFLAANGGTQALVDTKAGFDSFRGVLINNSGKVIYFATPLGGKLGIFTGPDPLRDCLLSIGSPLFGSTIEDFALNPVSINDAGQLAIRVRLTDHRQFVLRADPTTTAPRLVARTNRRV